MSGSAIVGAIDHAERRDFNRQAHGAGHRRRTNPSTECRGEEVTLTSGTRLARYNRPESMLAPFDNASPSRTRIVVSHLTDPSDDREYWWRQTPEARLAALETMRQVVYGYDPAAGRLQRLLELAQRAPR